MHITSGTSRLAVYANTTAHTVIAASADGVDVDEGEAEDRSQPKSTGPSGWGLVFLAAPPDGLDVQLKVRGEGPLPLRVVAYRSGLPDVTELTAFPDDLRWSADSSNLTMITATYRV